RSAASCREGAPGWVEPSLAAGSVAEAVPPPLAVTTGRLSSAKSVVTGGLRRLLLTLSRCPVTMKSAVGPAVITWPICGAGAAWTLAVWPPSIPPAGDGEAAFGAGLCSAPPAGPGAGVLVLLIL